MPRDLERRRESQRRASRKWYASNKEKQVKANGKRAGEIAAWFRELKATLCCAQCGESHPACLDFHHNNPTEKEKSLFLAVSRARWGREKILKEIGKCTVLCANCHRKFHYDLQRNNAHKKEAC